MPQLTEAEIAEREARNRAELDRLNAKPWRGVCPACPGRMWCTDTEGEAERLVSEHIETEHVRLTPQVWRDHDDPEPEQAALPGPTADTRMAIDPDGKVKPVSEFTAEERWWCECDDDQRPHAHCHGHLHVVDLETGRDAEGHRWQGQS